VLLQKETSRPTQETCLGRMEMDAISFGFSDELDKEVQGFQVGPKRNFPLDTFPYREFNFFGKATPHFVHLVNRCS
jgi:hypothetical protein